MEIQVKSVDSKYYQIIKNNEILGELVYPKYYTLNAKVTTNNQDYTINPVDYWENKIILSSLETSLLSYRITWSGVMELKDLINDASYLIKRKGLFNRVFYLFNKENTILLSLKEDNRWSDSSPEYTIELTEQFLKIENNNLLLLMIIYGLNYYKTYEGDVVTYDLG